MAKSPAITLVRSLASKAKVAARAIEADLLQALQQCGDASLGDHVLRTKGHLTVTWPVADAHVRSRRRFQCRSANASGDSSLATHQSLREWSSAYDSASAVSANNPIIWKPSAGLPHIKIVVGIGRLTSSSMAHGTIAKAYWTPLCAISALTHVMAITEELIAIKPGSAQFRYQR
jgi:hypothetical protein